MSIERRKRPVVVAVVDSGIDSSIADLSNYVIKSTGFGINHDGYIVENREKEVQHFHGTAIAMVIRYICPNVRLVSVNILNERLVTDGRVLIQALGETVSFKPDIINLSLGTTKWRYKWPLTDIVKEAIKNNVYIVSAANNENVRSYPAYLRGVIGVKAAKDIELDEYYFKKNMFYAPAHLQGVDGSDLIKDAYGYSGTSFSAAYITGHLANLISNNNSLDADEVVNTLKHNPTKLKGGDGR